MYPTLEEVAAADHEQLARWYRFLPSPGLRAAGCEDFVEVLEREVEVMTLIQKRLGEFGGFTPELSKKIGW